MKAYTDADWDSSLNDIRSTLDATLSLVICLESWANKKQASVSLSTVEAEYIVGATYCTQILWMKKNLKDMKVYLTDHIPIMCDDTSTIITSKNTIMHSKKKHISIKFHFLWEQIAANVVRLWYVDTKEQF